MAKRFILSVLAILLYMLLWVPVLLLITAANPDPIIFAIMIPAIFILYFPWFFWSIKKVWFFKAEGIPVPLEELRKEILSINNYDIPVIVTEDKKGNLKVTWKYLDAKWWELFAKTGRRDSYTLLVKFNDKKKEVRLIDIQKTMSWRAGLTDLKFHFTFFRGIMFQFSYGTAWGIKENFTLGKIYEYKFNPGEIKSPVMSEILKKGWNVRFALF